MFKLSNGDELVSVWSSQGTVSFYFSWFRWIPGDINFKCFVDAVLFLMYFAVSDFVFEFMMSFVHSSGDMQEKEVYHIERNKFGIVG